MYGLNRVTLIGHVATDLTFFELKSGIKLLKFRLVTSERWKDKDGEVNEQLEWHTIAVFNDALINLANNLLEKGDGVMIEGRLHTRNWKDKEGHKHTTAEIILDKYSGKLVLLRKKDIQND
ncbi:single-stranded DNA-binding protein [Bartonella sp. DGB1]|uniref:single-stranded DNA-binding protein n=1 Tax=Bartonella sp. DGB1 TaxID=3239807 RepID=UPI003524F633